MNDSVIDPRAAIRRQNRLAAVVLALLFVVMGGGASLISIAGAVIAVGQIAVASDVKKVQHPTGGIVSTIAVKDGSRVRAGDLLVSLDATATGANARVVTDAIDQLSAKAAGLTAERDGSRPVFSAAVSPTGGASVWEERRLLAIRATARASEKARLREQRDQVMEQVVGYRDLIAAKKEQIGLIDRELVGVRTLFTQNLVPLARLNALERDAVQLRGDIAQLEASLASSNQKISELEVQILEVDQNARADAGNQLSQVEGQLLELRQKHITTQEELRRVDIRAPQDGVVDRLSVHTVGGVISPGETIMVIVPDKDALVVKARIKPTDIDKVSPGQAVTLRFTAFDQRTTPEVSGRIEHVSAESETEEKSGASFYTAEIAAPAAEVAKLGVKLVPGMPVEAFIQTKSRSILSYLVKPLADQITRAFRE